MKGRKGCDLRGRRRLLNGPDLRLPLRSGRMRRWAVRPRFRGLRSRSGAFGRRCARRNGRRMWKLKEI